MLRIVNYVRFTWTGRIIIVSVVIVSTLAIYWSLNTRLALLYGSRSLTHQLASVQNEIDSLQLQWQSENAEKKLHQLNDLESRRIMSGNADLLRWLDSLIQKARRKHVALDYRTDAAKPSKRFPDLLQVSVVLTFTFDASMKADRAYSTILQFSRDLIATTDYRLEIDQMVAQGNAKKLQDIAIFLRVWMRNDAVSMVDGGVR